MVNIGYNNDVNKKNIYDTFYAKVVLRTDVQTYTSYRETALLKKS